MTKQWVDPRPQFPPFGSLCVVQCSDGTLRQAICRETFEGIRWQDPRAGFWSLAHPDITGWKLWSEASEEERKEGKKYGY